MVTSNGIKTKKEQLLHQTAACGMTFATNLNNQSCMCVFLAAPWVTNMYRVKSVASIIKSPTRTGTLARFCASCKMEGKEVKDWTTTELKQYLKARDHTDLWIQ